MLSEQLVCAKLSFSSLCGVDEVRTIPEVQFAKNRGLTKGMNEQRILVFNGSVVKSSIVGAAAEALVFLSQQRRNPP